VVSAIAPTPLAYIPVHEGAGFYAKSINYPGGTWHHLFHRENGGVHQFSCGGDRSTLDRELSFYKSNHTHAATYNCDPDLSLGFNCVVSQRIEISAGSVCYTGLFLMYIKDRQEMPFLQWELWFGENGPERHCSREPGLPSVVARELEIATTVLKLAVFAS